MGGIKFFFSSLCRRIFFIIRITKTNLISMVRHILEMKILNIYKNLLHLILFYISIDGLEKAYLINFYDFASSL